MLIKTLCGSAQLGSAILKMLAFDLHTDAAVIDVTFPAVYYLAALSNMKCLPKLIFSCS